MSKKEINIGLIGLGTVGTGVAKILMRNKENLANRAGAKIVLKKAADIDLKKDRGIKFTEGQLTNDAEEILNDPQIDIVVEVVGGIKPAKSFIEKALKHKKHVVTSNKEVIAKHGLDFIKLAKEQGVNIYYEAAVGGGIPIIHSLKNTLAANNIEKIFGIVNGTTNFILTKMYQEGADFTDVLKEAQDLGFAEADPSADIDGYDVAYKLAILSSIAFNSHFKYEDIYFEGISDITSADIKIAAQFGYVIKMLAVGIEHKNKNVELHVHPVMIEKDHPLANVNGSYNAVFVKGNYVKETMFYGPGAGELPTASAVVGDVLDLAMHDGLEHSHPSMLTNFADKKVVPMGEIHSKFYMRLTVKDQPGVLAGISKICGDNMVSIKSVQQKDSQGVNAELVIITHKVKEDSMQTAIKAIKKLKSVENVNSVIRVGL